MRTQNKQRFIAQFAIAAAVSLSLALGACGDGPGGGGSTDPEITGFSFTPASVELKTDTAAGTVVGTFSKADGGGTGNFSYTIVSGGEGFTIDGDELKVADSGLTAGAKTLTVKATDAKGKTFQKVLPEIAVLISDAENNTDPITGFTFTATASLQAGEANTAAGASAGTFSAVTGGGTEPYTFLLAAGTGGNDADNDSFEIDNAATPKALKVKTALTTGGTKKVYVQVVDNLGKHYEQAITLTVAYPEIKSISFIEAAPALTPTTATSGAVAGTLSAVGGTAPITYAITSQYYYPVSGSSTSGTFFTLDADGTLKVAAGQTLAEGQYGIWITATDAQGQTYSQSMYVNIFASFLRGTVTFTGIGTPAIDYVNIHAYDDGNYFGSGSLTLGAVSGGSATGTWAIPLAADEVFTGNKSIRFDLYIAFTDDSMISKTVTKTVSASTQNVALGTISAAAIRLSGTIGTVTVDGTQYTAGSDYINMFAYDGNTYLDGTFVESDGTWSITTAALSSLRTVTFRLQVYDSSGHMVLINYIIPDISRPVSNTNVTGIALGNLTVTLKEITFTLSGFTGGVNIMADPASYTTFEAMAAAFISSGAYSSTETSTGTASMFVPTNAPALYFYVVGWTDNKVYKTASSSSGTSVSLTKGSMTYLGSY